MSDTINVKQPKAYKITVMDTHFRNDVVWTHCTNLAMEPVWVGFTQDGKERRVRCRNIFIEEE